MVKKEPRLSMRTSEARRAHRRQEREETPAASIGTRQENLLRTVSCNFGKETIFPFTVELKIR
jgi:hypothetical protein